EGYSDANPWAPYAYKSETGRFGIGKNGVNEPFCIKDDGKNGMGMSDPQATLEVAADGAGRSIVCGRGNGGHNCHIDTYDSGVGTRGLYLNYLTGTGVYLASGVSVTSDLRKKRDVETIPNALEKIGAIR